MPVKIVVIDDNIIERARVVKLLNYCETINLKLFEGGSENAVKLIEQIKPDIIFIEIIMKKYSGFEIINKVVDLGYRATIIYINNSDKYAIKSIRNYAFDYLVKPVSIDELKKSLNRFLNDNYSMDNGDILDTSSLSIRELDVLKQVINGLSSKEIAVKLNISINTVNTHRSNLLKKCHVKNVAELINKARNLFI